MSDLVFVDEYKGFKIKIFYSDEGHVAHVEQIADGTKIASTIHYRSRTDAFREAEMIIDGRLARVSAV